MSYHTMKMLSAAVAAALVTMLPALPAAASPKILVDVRTGEVLYGEDASQSWHPASLTKLMTANLAFKAVREGRMSDLTPIVMTEHAASVPPSRLGIPPGHGLMLGDALRIMLTRSMNDVATAIGENLAGSEPSFAAAMNEEAARLGMKGTHFANASGLPDPSQVSTAEDLAILARHIIREYPERMPLFSIPELSVAGKTFRNTNGLIGRYAGADGMKTGYVCSSGFNLVSTASRDGRRLLSVVLGAPNPRQREMASSQMLDYGFKKPQASEVTLSSGALSPRPAADMKIWKCGKTYPGFSVALKPGPQSLEIAIPRPRPLETRPEQETLHVRTVRRF
ncbi:D-alanyl-D-alanine carboxypeptidase DacF precursor [compost metagenome]